MGKKTAILGWGSLLWEANEDFDLWHGPWQYDGPSLDLEFSRISQSRQGVLTLVIDSKSGSKIKAAYCWSNRPAPEDAISDLQYREGTTRRNIGYYCRDTNKINSRDEECRKEVVAWADSRNVDVVIWVDLPSNFEEKVGRQFSVSAAISYLKGLDATRKAKAFEYLRRAPSFVQTPLRKALQAEPWFVEDS